MQGIIYNVLADFIIEQHGMLLWNEILQESAVPSGGSYTSGATYADEEAVVLAGVIAHKLGVSVEDALRAFGEYLFPQLLARGPVEIHEYQTLIDLLDSLDSTVHAEVKRISPQAYLPTFYFTHTAAQGKLVYHSKRKMCPVAEGLLQGAAKHFNQQIELRHIRCMHRGHEQCEWDIIFTGAQ